MFLIKKCYKKNTHCLLSYLITTAGILIILGISKNNCPEISYNNSLITFTVSLAIYSASSRDNVVYTGSVISFSYWA